MFAMLFPEKLADAAMAEVERMANDPVPRSERPARIAALEREIDERGGAHRRRGRAWRDRPSVGVGDAPGSARRQDRGAWLARGMTLRHDPRRLNSHVGAVPLGRWTAINSREPADWAPSGRGGCHASCLAAGNVRFCQHRICRRKGP